MSWFEKKLNAKDLADYKKTLKPDSTWIENGITMFPWIETQHSEGDVTEERKLAEKQTGLKPLKGGGTTLHAKPLSVLAPAPAALADGPANPEEPTDLPEGKPEGKPGTTATDTDLPDKDTTQDKNEADKEEPTAVDANSDSGSSGPEEQKDGEDKVMPLTKKRIVMNKISTLSDEDVEKVRKLLESLM